MTESDNQEHIDETFILPKGAENNPLNMIYERFLSHFTPFGFQRRDEDIVYHPLPYVPKEDDVLLLEKPWRIILELYDEDHRMVMGLDLYGDVVLGRGDSRPGRILIDLEEYGARELGVSREHLLMRPTRNKLFAIDQGSTNRTTINGAPAGRGVAMTLHDQDLLNLGNMVIMIHVVSTPTD
ncbi:MAG: FHA domain-containing protein [Chloroflexi bacterium]|nr:FHA domain-containing protein [Chloroflexota bacterium]